MVEKEQKDAGMVQGYVDLAVELCGELLDMEESFMNFMI